MVFVPKPKAEFLLNTGLRIFANFSPSEKMQCYMPFEECPPMLVMLTICSIVKFSIVLVTCYFTGTVFAALIQLISAIQ